jgi:hypothetical protein
MLWSGTGKPAKPLSSQNRFKKEIYLPNRAGVDHTGGILLKNFEKEYVMSAFSCIYKTLLPHLSSLTAPPSTIISTVVVAYHPNSLYLRVDRSLFFLNQISKSISHKQCNSPTSPLSFSSLSLL